jgi:hypothetical protein
MTYLTHLYQSYNSHTPPSMSELIHLYQPNIGYMLIVPDGLTITFFYEIVNLPFLPNFGNVAHAKMAVSPHYIIFGLPQPIPDLGHIDTNNIIPLLIRGETNKENHKIIYDIVTEYITYISIIFLFSKHVHGCLSESDSLCTGEWRLVFGCSQSC